MNRISAIGPLVLLAVPIALLLIALGVERVGLRNGRLVKSALAVNTCLAFFSIFVWGSKAAAQDTPQVECYDVSIVPYTPSFDFDEEHAAFSTLSKLDAELTQEINKGEYNHDIYLGLKEHITKSINELRVEQKLSLEETTVAREYFEGRLQTYADLDIQIMCYKMSL